MMNFKSTYDGHEWQQKVLTWLRLRYRGQFENVPDQHIGDFGIEGFSRDGKAYQCYSPKDPLKAGDLYINQRDKMTEDIGKFIKNRSDLSKLFGDLKIKEWWFITPEHKSARLTQHAEKKRIEVLQANLPYVDPDFIIHIATGEDFASEQKISIETQLQQLRLDSPYPKEIAILEWADRNDELVKTLDDKISRLLRTQDSQNIIKYRNEVIRHYITGQNCLERLRNESCELWEKISQCLRDREKFLASECMDSPDTPKSTLREQRNLLHQKINSDVPGLHLHTVDEIVHGITNSWMIVCPIDFLEVSGAS